MPEDEGLLPLLQYDILLYRVRLLCGVPVHAPYLSDTAGYAAAWKDGLFPEDASLCAGSLGGGMRIGSRHPSFSIFFRKVIVLG